MNTSIHEKMDYHVSKGKDILEFTGYNLLSNLFYLYLFHKYKTDCILGAEDISGFDELGLKLDIDKNENDTSNQDIRQIVEQISKCQKTDKPIIIPFSLRMSNFAHANLIIVRPKQHIIEHFEPHGSKYMGEKSNKINRRVQQFLEQFTRKLNIGKSHKYRLLHGTDICPNIYGLQHKETNALFAFKHKKEGGGYCAAWSMFFTEMVLKNPELTSRQVYDNIMEKTNKHMFKGTYLLNMIRGYIHHISNKLDKYYTHLFGTKINVTELVDKFKDNLKDETHLYHNIQFLVYLELIKANNRDFDLEEEKQQIRELIQNKISPELHRAYAIRMNVLNRYQTLEDIRSSSSSAITQSINSKSSKNSTSKNSTSKKSSSKKSSSKNSSAKNSTSKKSPISKTSKTRKSDNYFIN